VGHRPPCASWSPSTPVGLRYHLQRDRDDEITFYTSSRSWAAWSDRQPDLRFRACRRLSSGGTGRLLSETERERERRARARQAATKMEEHDR